MLTLHPCLTWRARLCGVYAYKALGIEEGLWIQPCRGVHTLGLKQPLDVVFLNSLDQPIAVYPALRPNRCVWHWGARSVVELPAGFCQQHPNYAAQITTQLRQIRACRMRS